MTGLFFPSSGSLFIYCINSSILLSVQDICRETLRWLPMGLHSLVLLCLLVSHLEARCMLEWFLINRTTLWRTMRLRVVVNMGHKVSDSLLNITSSKKKMKKNAHFKKGVMLKEVIVVEVQDFCFSLSLLAVPPNPSHSHSFSLCATSGSQCGYF